MGVTHYLIKPTSCFHKLYLKLFAVDHNSSNTLRVGGVVVIKVTSRAAVKKIRQRYWYVLRTKTPILPIQIIGQQWKFCLQPKNELPVVGFSLLLVGPKHTCGDLKLANQLAYLFYSFWKVLRSYGVPGAPVICYNRHCCADYCRANTYRVCAHCLDASLI